MGKSKTDKAAAASIRAAAQETSAESAGPVSIGHSPRHPARRSPIRIAAIAFMLVVALAGASVIAVAHFAFGLDVSAFGLNASEAANVVSGDPAASEKSQVRIGEDDDSIGDDVLVEVEGLSEGVAAADANTTILQNAIDGVARQGGGTVLLPMGSYYFTAGGRYSHAGYVVEARSGVTVKGRGESETTLLPYGTWAQTGDYASGIDMFWYDGMDSGVYLEDADFADLTIDGRATRGSDTGYNASGKGFFFKLFRDCDWDHVTVANTDGTGFGADFPIDCTLRDCTARACGKNATAESIGASGFGVGVGYSNDESILIENCVSDDNTKFGYFFEHQTIFGTKECTADRSDGFVVKGCSASGNLYNFGGNRAYDVSYVSCVSTISDSPEHEAYTQSAYMLEGGTVRVSFENCKIEQGFSDIQPTDDCFDAVRWALDKGVAESGSGEARAFQPNAAITRRETALMFWRLAGWPGNVEMGKSVDLSQVADDVPGDDPCAEAVRWLRSRGLSISKGFRPDDSTTVSELATLLWRLAGKPGADDTGESDNARRHLSQNTASSGYVEALDWATSCKVIDAHQASTPNRAVTRAEAVTALYAYAHLGL